MLGRSGFWTGDLELDFDALVEDMTGIELFSVTVWKYLRWKRGKIMEVRINATLGQGDRAPRYPGRKHSPTFDYEKWYLVIVEDIGRTEASAFGFNDQMIRPLQLKAMGGLYNGKGRFWLGGELLGMAARSTE